MKINKKYLMLIFAGLLLTASLVFFIYTIKADSDDNEIGISYAELTGIKTGTDSFSDDGLDYSNTANFHATSGYIAGNDRTDENAIVRSFDKVTYDFDLGIKKKDEIGNTAGLTAYSGRTILITATISEEAAKYVIFGENNKPGQTSYTYEVKNVNEINGSKVNASISLYVLGAPNGTIIDPKFEITESTNTDDEYVVTLGKLENKHNYLFDATKDTAYSTAANFKNYLPTVVSSNSNINLNLSLVGVDTQKATYESKQGRYMNYVLSIYATGSIKGQTMPTGDIVLNGSYSQNGSEGIILKPEFVRLYSESNTGDIVSPVANKPYSSTSVVTNSKYTRMPGNILASNISNNAFNITISDLGMSYSYPTSNADNSAISSNESYLGTYLITLFSPRVASDGTNDINVNLSIDGTNIDLVNGSTTVSGVSASLVNSGYVESDYNLETGFYEMNGTKIESNDSNVAGGKSRGSEIQYITTFNYSSTGSNEGLKEIIKIDPVAFRFMDYSPSEEFDIKVYCGDKECTNISGKDFEYAFVAGDFKASNYDAANYETVSDKINEDDANLIQSACTTVKNNLENYNSDQIMNLYGGPCISEKSPMTYNSISNAVTSDNEEIVLSKLIVQTKEGVNLPSNVKVVIKTKLRIRNVQDITKKYQATAIATSSDYDSKITYYAPRVTNNDNSEQVVTNPNNYRKDSNSRPKYGDVIRILNFEAKSKVTVTNKTKDGRMKTNFNAVDNETIHFKVSTTTSDYNMNVGADDAWYFRTALVIVNMPNSLTYVPNDSYLTPDVINSSGATQLTFEIPLTKPNQAIPDIYFDAILSSNLTGNGNEINVRAQPIFININNERYDYYMSTDILTIYGNGINNMVLSITNDGGTKIEKNAEFSYNINAYNNTDSVIDNYEILSVLPSNTDGRGTTFSGSYKVRLDASNLGSATVMCTTYDLNNITPQMEETETIYTECPNIFSADGVSATAFKISNISVQGFSSIAPIKVYIMPEGNKYSDIYKVSITGGSDTYMPTNSNELTYEVISRKITGKVFIDVDEDGVQKGDDKGLANIPVSLFKMVDDNNMELVKETTTLESGKYTFDNLDKGFYKIRLNYDDSLYDVSLRYATEDTNIDSDAYKLDEGLAEITNKHDPYSHEGIDLVSNTEVNNMDMGLLNRKPFAMSIKKYITKIDLSYNGITDTKHYNNESKVLISVRNSLKATAKVYYGFEIINNSQVPGYVSNIYENIPDGLLFDSNNPYNAGWVYVNGKLQNTTFQSQKILPGESIYAQVVLSMPSREEAGSFLNKVSLEIKSAEERNIKDASMNNDSEYTIGELVNYENSNWNVIGIENRGNDQLLTLLLNDDSAIDYHRNISGPYKWSSNSHFGAEYINQSVFEDQVICDDASSLVGGSHGGELKSTGKCTSGIYHTTKVRLLTEEEYNAILNLNLQDISWLMGSHDYYLTNAVNIPIEYNEYGQVTTNYSNYVKYVDVGTSSIGYTDITSNSSKRYRPVITVNSKYILNY